jgi:hypothetical protein
MKYLRDSVGERKRTQIEIVVMIANKQERKVVTESEGFEPPSPFGRRFSRPVQ